MSANKLFKAVITKAVEQQILLEILPWEQILQEGLNTLSLACFLNQEKSFPASAHLDICFTMQILGFSFSSKLLS